MTVTRDIKSISLEEVEDLVSKIRALPLSTSLCYRYLSGKDEFIPECYHALSKLRSITQQLEDIIERLRKEHEPAY